MPCTLKFGIFQFLFFRRQQALNFMVCYVVRCIIWMWDLICYCYPWRTENEVFENVWELKTKENIVRHKATEAWWKLYNGWHRKMWSLQSNWFSITFHKSRNFNVTRKLHLVLDCVVIFTSVDVWVPVVPSCSVTRGVRSREQSGRSDQPDRRDPPTRIYITTT